MTGEVENAEHLMNLDQNDRDAEGYRDWARHTANELSQIKPNYLRFGPTYKTSTSAGESLTIHTVIVPSSEGNENFPSALFLIAEGPDHKIAGHRGVHFRTKKGNAEGAGLIATKKGGVASSIELAFIDSLQRLANQFRTDVTYKATNFNGNTDLAEIHSNFTMLSRAYEKGFSREMGFNSPQEHMVEVEKARLKLHAKQREQDRWMQLWGPNGQLGFTQEGGGFIRTFHTQEDVKKQRADEVGVINLGRQVYSKNGRTLMEGIATIIDQGRSDESTQMAKRNAFTEELLPKLVAEGV